MLKSPINIFQSTFDCRGDIRSNPHQRSGLNPREGNHIEGVQGARTGDEMRGRREIEGVGVYGSGMRSIARIASRRPDAILHY